MIHRVHGTRVAAAVAIGAVVYLGANAVDEGLTQPWPMWARASWASGLILGTLTAVFLLLTGLGILTNERLRDRGDGSSPNRGRVTVGVFITVYVAILILAVSLAFGLKGLYHVPAERTVPVSLGGMYLVASTGRPWWLYETVRRVRWFALFESDAVMRVVLAVIGAGLVLVGLLVKIE